MHLELLQRILAMGTAKPTTTADTFPSNELRFVFEYKTPPVLTAVAAEIAAYLDSNAFQLDRLSPAPSLARFAILRFPGVERTLRQQVLFDIAYDFCAQFNLISAEPDLGSGFYADPDIETDRQLESALAAATCQVSDTPPEDRRWSIRNVRADLAWSLSKGAGILIGHPDTGIAKHDELQGEMFELSLGLDLIDGDALPEDPLHAGMANPGHGTATSSVIASRQNGNIDGIAPEARIVPIRCIEDVKVFNQAPVAAAIAHAHAAGCHIISMSLGGVPSRALHAAVKAAVDDGIIVLAAAGNCVRTVVWPARYDEVIAIGGTNVHDRPWKGSCRGPAVDISAPAEQVWCAKRSIPGETQSAVKAGQGTSYAVATVAGIAALWLSKHSVTAVRQEAAKRNLTVSSLFKAALQYSARRPDNWDGDQFGSGIADASSLLQIELSAIPVMLQREFTADPARSIRQMLANENGALPADNSFDWEQYGCELATIALSQAMIGSNLAELTREAKSPGTNPSNGLASAIDQSVGAALRKFGATEKTSISKPLVSAVYPAPGNNLRHALSLRGTGLESTAGAFDVDRTRDYLRGSGRQEQLIRLGEVLSSLPSISPRLRDEVLSAADEALVSASVGSSMGSIGKFGVEALVALTGRPALRTYNGDLRLDDPRAAEWQDRLYMPVSGGQLKKVIAAVGRIDLHGRHVGTGFVVAPNLVLTNRHVLQELAAAIPTRNNPTGWLLDDTGATIDFADSPNAATMQSKFKIVEVVGWGPRYIEDSTLDLSLIDAAILRIESTNAANLSSPTALTLSSDLGKVDRFDPVLTIGYPAMPGQLPRTAAGKVDDAVAGRLAELFDDYSVRYVSPGEVITQPDRDTKGPNYWTFRHDATTLGGSSGSAVLALDPALNVVGLHFGGSWLRENFAHALANLQHAGQVVNNPLILWK